MKKTLIIQTESEYFLFETLQLLKNLKQDRQYTIFTEDDFLDDMESISEFWHIKTIKFVTNEDKVLAQKFDESFNLSLNEKSQALQKKVQENLKDGQDDLPECSYSSRWKNYLQTYRHKSPFLTFHLRDIFKNIILSSSPFLGNVKENNHQELPLIKRIAYSRMGPQSFSFHEQEKFLILLSQALNIPIFDLSEIDVMEDIADVLYIGPPIFEALNLLQEGASSILLSTRFTGANLFPYEGNHYLVTPSKAFLEADPLMSVIKKIIEGEELYSLDFSIYKPDRRDDGHLFLSCQHSYDISYPFYVAHFITWSYLLNEQDVLIPLNKSTHRQNQALREYLDVSVKVSRYLNEMILRAESHIEHFIEELTQSETILSPLAFSHQYLAPFIHYFDQEQKKSKFTKINQYLESSLLTLYEFKGSLDIITELLNKLMSYRANELIEQF